MKKINIKEIVGNNHIALFSHAIAGVLYYTVKIASNIEYQFTIDMNDKEDVGSAVFPNEIKAITLMRYIRKAIENESLVELF